MTVRAKKWKTRQQQLENIKPMFRIDSCRIEQRNGTYMLVCEGVGLHPAVSPPVVTIGGETVLNPKFQVDGRRLSAELPTLPKGRDVIIDLGYAKSNVQAEMK